MTAIYLKDLPDVFVLVEAEAGDQGAIAEAIKRGIYPESAKVTKSLEEALANVKLEWIEE